MDRLTLLKNIPLFDELTDDELTALVQRCSEQSVASGAMVFEAGHEGDSLFLIIDGAIDIHTGEGKLRTTFASLFSGQIFGELSLFDGSPRSATATATKDTTLLSLDREDFTVFLKAKPEAGIKIMSELAQRIRATNDLFASQVSRDVLEEAEESLTVGQKIADAVATFGGSWTFIIVFIAMMAVWMGGNLAMGEQAAFDWFPFVFLNLALSTTAALQAPVIMMSQNRQASKDKLLAQNDYLVNLKAELGIQQLLKNQAEVLQRIAIVERHLGHHPHQPHHRAAD
jgi:CRP/FNR family cyclic AMP-dependent transcriptional regulator